ncbi:MAG: DUF4430 domain-containing protein [Candidatus Diapherotrites archaeon]|nr:DUF4430 domain-containing protein [Candidatus Diapherotrites archaeon]
MNDLDKKFFAFVILLVLLFGCTQQLENEAENTVQSAKFSLKVSANGETLVDKALVLQKGTNALKAMKSAVKVQTQETSFGEFVTGIAGVQADSKHYWALYVNGKYAEKGIGQYTLEEDTLIEWQLEEIK